MRMAQRTLVGGEDDREGRILSANASTPVPAESLALVHLGDNPVIPEEGSLRLPSFGQSAARASIGVFINVSIEGVEEVIGEGSISLIPLEHLRT